MSSGSRGIRLFVCFSMVASMAEAPLRAQTAEEPLKKQLPQEPYRAARSTPRPQFKLSDLKVEERRQLVKFITSHKGLLRIGSGGEVIDVKHKTPLTKEQALSLLRIEEAIAALDQELRGLKTEGKLTEKNAETYRRRYQRLFADLGKTLPWIGIDEEKARGLAQLRLGHFLPSAPRRVPSEGDPRRSLLEAWSRSDPARVQRALVAREYLHGLRLVTALEDHYREALDGASGDRRRRLTAKLNSVLALKKAAQEALKEGKVTFEDVLRRLNDEKSDLYDQELYGLLNSAREGARQAAAAEAVLLARARESGKAQQVESRKAALFRQAQQVRDLAVRFGQGRLGEAQLAAALESLGLPPDARLEGMNPRLAHALKALAQEIVTAKKENRNASLDRYQAFLDALDTAATEGFVNKTAFNEFYGKGAGGRLAFLRRYGALDRLEVLRGAEKRRAAAAVERLLKLAEDPAYAWAPDRKEEDVIALRTAFRNAFEALGYPVFDPEKYVIPGLGNWESVPAEFTARMRLSRKLARGADPSKFDPEELAAWNKLNVAASGGDDDARRVLVGLRSPVYSRDAFFTEAERSDPSSALGRFLMRLHEAGGAFGNKELRQRQIEQGLMTPEKMLAWAKEQERRKVQKGNNPIAANAGELGRFVALDQAARVHKLLRAYQEGLPGRLLESFEGLGLDDELKLVRGMRAAAAKVWGGFGDSGKELAAQAGALFDGQAVRAQHALANAAALFKAGVPITPAQLGLGENAKKVSPDRVGGTDGYTTAFGLGSGFELRHYRSFDGKTHRLAYFNKEGKEIGSALLKGVADPTLSRGLTGSLGPGGSITIGDNTFTMNAKGELRTGEGGLETGHDGVFHGSVVVDSRLSVRPWDGKIEYPNGSYLDYEIWEKGRPVRGRFGGKNGIKFNFQEFYAYDTPDRKNVKKMYAKVSEEGRILEALAPVPDPEEPGKYLPGRLYSYVRDNRLQETPVVLILQGEALSDYRKGVYRGIDKYERKHGQRMAHVEVQDPWSGKGRETAHLFDVYTGQRSVLSFLPRGEITQEMLDDIFSGRHLPYMRLYKALELTQKTQLEHRAKIDGKDWRYPEKTTFYEQGWMEKSRSSPVKVEERRDGTYHMWLLERDAWMNKGRDVPTIRSVKKVVINPKDGSRKELWEVRFSDEDHDEVEGPSDRRGVEEAKEVAAAWYKERRLKARGLNWTKVGHALKTAGGFVFHVVASPVEFALGDLEGLTGVALETVGSWFSEDLENAGKLLRHQGVEHMGKSFIGEAMGRTYGAFSGESLKEQWENYYRKQGIQTNKDGKVVASTVHGQVILDNWRLAHKDLPLKPEHFFDHSTRLSITDQLNLNFEYAREAKSWEKAMYNGLGILGNAGKITLDVLVLKGAMKPAQAGVGRLWGGSLSMWKNSTSVSGRLLSSGALFGAGTLRTGLFAAETAALRAPFVAGLVDIVKNEDDTDIALAKFSSTVLGMAAGRFGGMKKGEMLRTAEGRPAPARTFGRLLAQETALMGGAIVSARAFEGLGFSAEDSALLATLASSGLLQPGLNKALPAQATPQQIALAEARAMARLLAAMNEGAGAKVKAAARGQAGQAFEVGGEVLDPNLTLVSRLGGGGFGEVFSVTTSDGKVLALKVANEVMRDAGIGLGGPEFENAVKADGLLPRPVAAYRVGKDGKWQKVPFDPKTGTLLDSAGTPMPGVVPDAILMEFVGGPKVQSIEEALAQKKLSLEQVEALARELYESLKAKGFVYWDRPSDGNVVVTWGEDGKPQFRVRDLGAVLPMGKIAQLPLEQFVRAVKEAAAQPVVRQDAQAAKTPPNGRMPLEGPIDPGSKLAKDKISDTKQALISELKNNKALQQALRRQLGRFLSNQDVVQKILDALQQTEVRFGGNHEVQDAIAQYTIPKGGKLPPYIVFDNSADVAGAPARDLAKVLLHELAHALGLGENAAHRVQVLAERNWSKRSEGDSLPKQNTRRADFAMRHGGLTDLLLDLYGKQVLQRDGELDTTLALEKNFLRRQKRILYAAEQMRRLMEQGKWDKLTERQKEGWYEEKLRTSEEARNVKKDLPSFRRQLAAAIRESGAKSQLEAADALLKNLKTSIVESETNLRALREKVGEQGTLNVRLTTKAAKKEGAAMTQDLAAAIREVQALMRASINSAPFDPAKGGGLDSRSFGGCGQCSALLMQRAQQLGLRVVPHQTAELFGPEAYRHTFLFIPLGRYDGQKWVTDPARGLWLDLTFKQFNLKAVFGAWDGEGAPPRTPMHVLNASKQGRAFMTSLFKNGYAIVDNATLESIGKAFNVDQKTGRIPERLPTVTVADLLKPTYPKLLGQGRGFEFTPEGLAKTESIIRSRASQDSAK